MFFSINVMSLSGKVLRAFIQQTVTHRFKGGEHPGFLFVAPFMQENSFAVGLSDST